VVILDRTPFYAESGGQVGDAGQLAEQGAMFEVADTVKLAGQFHGHVGTLKAGTLRRGDRVMGAIDAPRRAATVLNHSATHLLHAALRQVLGEHVQQKGSLVAPDRLRFDFSHLQPVTADELAEVERRVNAEIRANHEAEVRHMGMQEALEFGALALFGEKYGERVRVLRMGEGSTELCGGTHVARTGDIGLFKIVSEGGVSSGVRRIEAVSGQGALEHVAREQALLSQSASLLGGSTGELPAKLRALLEQHRQLQRELAALKAKDASGATADLSASARDVDGIKVVATRLEGFDAKALREGVDRLRQQLGDAVVVLAGVQDGKAALVAGVGGAAQGRVKAGELIAHVAGLIGGKGGGRADMAQGGGPDGPGLEQALSGVADWVQRPAAGLSRPHHRPGGNHDLPRLWRGRRRPYHVATVPCGMEHPPGEYRGHAGAPAPATGDSHAHPDPPGRRNPHDRRLGHRYRARRQGQPGADRHHRAQGRRGASRGDLPAHPARRRCAQHRRRSRGRGRADVLIGVCRRRGQTVSFGAKSQRRRCPTALQDALGMQGSGELPERLKGLPC
jgi:Ser-tRNA(Ala) deacylase AlaX